MADEQFYISSTKYTPPDLSADRTERLVASERLDFDEAERKPESFYAFREKT